MLALQTRHGRRIWLFSWSQLAIVGMQLGTAVGMAVIAIASSSNAAMWPAALVLALVLWAVVVPDSEAALLALLVYGTWWLAADRAASGMATLVAAWLALGFHLSVALAAAAPLGATVSPGVVRSLVRDVGLVMAFTLGALLVATVARGHAVTSSGLVVAAGLMLIGLLVRLASGGPRS
ncbi:MAG: hypothetical protein ACTHOG_02370 [Marmoricola sp.]